METSNKQNIAFNIYIKIFQFYCWAFRWFMPKNTVRAKKGDIVCISYKALRFKGKIAQVVETGWLYYELNNRHYKERDRTCAVVEITANDKTAFNFTPDEYYPFNFIYVIRVILLIIVTLFYAWLLFY